MFSDYNILEYKSPGDALGIDAFFQALTYACYYKSSAQHEDERKDDAITVVLVRNEYPETLVRYLSGKGCVVTEQEPGIYTVSGNVFFNIIILTTGSMDQTEYIWLNSLRSDLKKSDYINLLKRGSEMNVVESDYPDAVLSVVEQSNAGCAKWKEESGVASFLAEAKNEGIQQGRNEGRAEGRAEERLLTITNMLRNDFPKSTILALGYTEEEYVNACKKCESLSGASPRSRKI